MSILHTLRQYAIYTRIACHVAIKYLWCLPLKDYLPFLKKAWLLLCTFRHNRVIRIAEGYKLQLYLPAYPSPAFFHALENKLLRTPPAPTSIVFSMTRACGYKCPHCYQKKEQGKDIPEALLLETLQKVQETGVSFFNIEGGEPFLRFDRLLAMLQTLDQRAEVWVNSNGADVSREQLLALKQNGLTGIMVSVHSPDQTLHDAFTGIPHSFDAACQLIALCKKLDIAVAINSVLSEEEMTHGQLHVLMDLAKNLGAHFVQLIHPKPCGPWLEKTDNMQQSPELLKQVEAYHLHYNSSATAGYPSLAAQAFEERKKGVGCTAGAIDRFYITATGDMQPCEFLQLSFGNVQTESFSDIYTRMREAFATPCTGWLCCTQSNAIATLMRQKKLTTTPVPWEHTKDIITQWDKGTPTPLYAHLGIYKL